MNRLDNLPNDIIANIYEINRQQDLQKIQELENKIKMISIEKGILSDKYERMKDTLDDEYVFCEICEDFELRENVSWNICAFCITICCPDCIEDGDIFQCDLCDWSCCKDCIYDYKNYYHLCKYCLKEEARKTIQFNPIFRKYLCKIRN